MESIGEATGTVDATESLNETALAPARRTAVVVKIGPAMDVCDELWCHEPALERTLVVHLSDRERFLLTLAHGGVLSLQQKRSVLDGVGHLLDRLVMRCPTWSGRVDCCPYLYWCACLAVCGALWSRTSCYYHVIKRWLQRAAGVLHGTMVGVQWDVLF